MKVILEQIASGEDGVRIQYSKMTPELLEALQILRREGSVIAGRSNERQYLLNPQDIYYFECVDEKLFAYTKDREVQVSMTLAEVEESLCGYGFFRCNKSFAVNLNKVESVRSEMGNRIDATLRNGEHIIISRHYAKQFREILKGGK